MIHDVALMMDRERTGRWASPSTAVIESQTAGRLLLVNLTTADIADSAGAQAILGAIAAPSNPNTF